MRKQYFPIFNETESLYNNYIMASDQKDIYNDIEQFALEFIETTEPFTVGVMEELNSTDNGYTVKFNRETYQLKLVKID